MTEPGRILAAAEADRADAAEALAHHQLTCRARFDHPPRDCALCESLAAHVERTERQIALLAAPGETKEMF